MKITLPSPKPRNRFVVACLQRHAGAHRRSPGGLRQQLQRELDRALRHIRHPEP